ncbi:MAG: hypothetical protein C9356_16660 [Oleiphilus sp.]|nr:MAG: hypothetical protein C9356_16660 [Oleiphilus sp.]
MGKSMSDTESQGTVDVSAHPGAILKAAREESPYSIEQVADALHLRSSVVLAMEQEKYQEFDSEVFLKGYYRSYCRLVGLHEERMVELLERQLAAHRSTLAEEAAEVEKARVAQKRARLLRYSIVLVVVSALVLATLYMIIGNDGEEETAPASQPETSERANAETMRQPSAESESEAPDVVAMHENVESPSPMSTSIETTDTAEAPLEIIEQPSGISELQAEAESQVALQNTANETASRRPELVSQTNLPESALEQAGESSSAMLSISFEGDCWLKVVNGNGDTAVARLQRKGDLVNYKGPLPFTVVLGNARVASVKYMNEAFDMAPFIRSNGRAEFVLD